jgi:hypothetical protein
MFDLLSPACADKQETRSPADLFPCRKKFCAHVHWRAQKSRAPFAGGTNPQLTED